MALAPQPAGDRTARFSPLRWLDRAYESQARQMAFRGSTAAELVAWQKGLRERVTASLGGFPETRVPLHPQVLEARRFPGYTRHRVVYDTAPDIAVPAYLLVPAGDGPFAAVVALHGHGYGKDEIVGIEWDGGERRGDPGYQKDFALRLVERGFVVLAPEQVAFGERREPEAVAQGPDACSCRKAAFHALMLGKTLLGLRVWDVMRAVDYLAQRPEVDAERIGCMGISGGGMTALFSAALDERLRAVVVSGYLNTFRASILAVPHCECNYVPELLRDAEMYDIAGLIAPRPLLAEHGTEDSIFPIDATHLALRELRRAYALLGAADRLDADVFAGPHEISGAKAYDWLGRWLQPPAPPGTAGRPGS